MDHRTLQYMAEACGGTLAGANHEAIIRNVCTDSRQAKPGDLFIALQGDRFDGHDFLNEAAAKGVEAAIVQAGSKLPGNWARGLILVSDTRSALLKLAARYRLDHQLPLVAIGGSNGKTTTKELLAAILQQRFSTLWSEASYNNHVGVPLTLLRLEKSHQVGVLEVGTNHPGELRPLLDAIRPTLSVITSIGREHLEYFGTLDRVAAEEGCLSEVLPRYGALFLGGQDQWLSDIARNARSTVVTASAEEGSDWRGRMLRMDGAGIRFSVEGPLPEFNQEYQVSLLGRHQLPNVMLAIAVAARCGCSPEDVVNGLAQFKPPKMRMQLWSLRGVHVLDDAYNANADSMVAALQTLVDLPCKGRRVAVLGDMAELGPHSDAAHEEVGRRAAELGVAQVFAVGAMASHLARGARGAGLARVFEFAEVESAATAIRSFVKSGDLVLLKASRATRLERIAELLRRN